jgi:C1A family cysteine protease
MEYQAELLEGSEYTREEAVYDLSEQWTYWNAKKIDPWGPEVEGTSIRYAMKVLQKIGCPPEKGWEYTTNKIDIGKPESWSHLVARWNTIDSYWRVSTLDHLVGALRDFGPIVIGVGCYEEIFNPNADGYVSYPKYPQYCYGGHAILACGYNAVTKRILFKNSWGSNWGRGGYGQFDYKYIKDFCWDAWAAKDKRVVSSMLEGSVSLT